jgi:mRNA degradation ribonuclease J1/J2
MEMFQKVETKGSIVVTCFSSNIARIETIAQAAEASGRMVCEKFTLLREF